MTSRNLWVVVVGFNGLEDTRLCLASLAAAEGGSPDTVYVDNASATDIAGAIEAEFPWCHVIRNTTNEGYAGGNNRGIRYTLDRGAELILVLNNDTIVAPDLLSTLVEAGHQYSEFGVLGPVIGFASNPNEVRTDGCLFNTRVLGQFFGRQPVPLAGARPHGVSDTDIVNGCCLMTRAEVFRSIGLFDERFFLVHEESDFCLRARRAGFRVGMLNQMLVWHKGSSSFKRTGRQLQRYYDVRNLALLLRTQSPFGHARRSRFRSWFAFWRYAYHMFCVELEAGEAAAATAVLEGLEDAVLGRVGPYELRPTRAAWLFGRAFQFVRTIKILVQSPRRWAALGRRP